MHSADERRNLALDMVRAAIVAADPSESVRRAITCDAGRVAIADWSARWADLDRVFVVGAGKASARMALACEQMLGEHVTGGIVVTKDGHGVPTERVVVLEAGHPVPDERGTEAAHELLATVAGRSERDLVIVVLSGGGSALLVAPAEGLTLADKQAATSALLACGATINDLNCVRKHLSRIKGGQLARACAPATVVSLILSDVIGDPLDVIASGPTVPDPTTFADAWGIVERYRLRSLLPEAVLNRLESGVHGQTPDTPKPGDAVFNRSLTHLVGTNCLALEAAAGRAAEAGYTPRVLTCALRGEACEVAKVVCALSEAVSPDSGPTALIFGGETTVTLSENPGKGGRNQELALAAAVQIAGREDVVVLSVGTDGTDGPTDAAGGIADGRTIRRAEERGHSPAAALVRHDAYPCLEAAGDLVITGPTGTNVMDVVIALVG